MGQVERHLGGQIAVVFALSLICSSTFTSSLPLDPLFSFLMKLVIPQ